MLQGSTSRRRRRRRHDVQRITMQDETGRYGRDGHENARLLVFSLTFALFSKTRVVKRFELVMSVVCIQGDIPIGAVVACANFLLSSSRPRH